jgi:hypothetical protein
MIVLFFTNSLVRSAHSRTRAEPARTQPPVTIVVQPSQIIRLCRHALHRISPAAKPIKLL